MADIPFVHLHCHSHYSLLDGAGRIDDLLDVVSGHGMQALALTDHGNLFGAIEFYTAARSRGIKPILGYEAYMAPASRSDTSRHQRAGGYYHLTLLAQNRAGYDNLLKLASAAYLEGFYRKPRIDKALLRDHSAGLICLSGCLRSEVCYALSLDEREAAEIALDEYAKIFDDRLYVELQYNGIEEQKKVSEALMEMADRKGLPVVVTNDVHYPTPESARVHEVMLCIQTGKTLADEERFKFATDEFYLKSGEEMAAVFPGREDAVRNTVEVAARFEMEYSVITKMGFATYFLIVEDFIRYARDSGISVGPGRGSAAGSIIAYALKITNIDPLRYDLIFERFLNEGRNELPDIDIDFDAERRSEVIEYVVQKYGRENVCQIITFGKIQARSGIRDVGRVLGMPLGKVDRIAKLVPAVIGIKLEEALRSAPDLKALYETDPDVTELIDIARCLEGIVRQTSVHAAGVIIADKPVSEYCPLQKVDDELISQYPMEQCGDIGLLKMDFLGLKNLTIIEHTLDLIEQATGARPDADALPMDDPKTYELLSAGDTRGIFQLESSGMREILVKLRPDRFEDVIAMVALYRPGPLGSGMVDSYIDCKHGRAQPHYPHPMLEETLAETNGVILYQEQVMRIAHMMGGFSLSESDKLRKAMGKKIQELMDRYGKQFREGAAERGIDLKVADEIFELMAEFAKYGFNKSHSAAYALVAYQTAYLKAHHRPQFMAALLSCNAGDTDKLVDYLDECRREGIEILPPDINTSQIRFVVEGEGIRYGLGAIKKCGTKALESIMAVRADGEAFRDLFDICCRVDTRRVNKAVLENLVRAGACDSLGGHRAQQVAALESFLKSAGAQGHGRQADQLGLFDDLSEEELPDAALPDVERWQDRDRLNEEKQALGFYYSGHPLEPFAATLKAYATACTTSLDMANEKRDVRLGGLITRMTTGIVRRGRTAGRKYARFVLEDIEGSCPAVCFPEVYDKFTELLANDTLVFVSGQVDTTGTEPGLLVTSIIPLNDVDANFATSVVIKLDASRHQRGHLEELMAILDEAPGKVPVYIELKTCGRELVTLSTHREMTVAPSAALADKLARLVGYDGFVFGGGKRNGKPESDAKTERPSTGRYR